MGTFGIAAVLRTTMRVWKRNLVPFMLIALLLGVPSLVAQSQIKSDDLLMFYLLMPLDLFVGALLSAALTYGVVMELNGARPSLRDCIVIGFGQLFAVVGVVIISLLGMFGAMFLLIVPGFIVMMWWYVAVPVAIVENLGVMASLRRSRELTHGRKGRVFGIFLIYWLVATALSMALSQVVSADARLFVNFATGAVLSSFNAVLTSVIYTALRREKDGITVPELATAFARFSGR